MLPAEIKIFDLKSNRLRTNYLDKKVISEPSGVVRSKKLKPLITPEGTGLSTDHYFRLSRVNALLCRRMKNFSIRDTEKEILDDLAVSGQAVSQNLKELDLINTLLGGNHISTSGLKKILSDFPQKKQWTIADIGCGSGELMLVMNRILKKENKSGTFTGYDANPFIVDYAQQHCATHPNVDILCHNVLTDAFTASYDVIHASLFLHHFTEEELVLLLRNLALHTKTALLINDLHRHPLAYYSIKWLTALFSKSHLVKNDAALSVAKGFTKKEWQHILTRAGFKRYSMQWVWAFRHRIIIYPDYGL